MRVVGSILLVVLCTGCATRADSAHVTMNVARVADFQPHWEPLFKGIDFAEARKMAPDPLAVYAIRIDLKEASI
jgi:hypothetical protein